MCEKRGTALKIRIPINSLQTIIKNSDKIENYVSSNSSCSKRLKTCVYEFLNEAILKWICLMRVKSVPNAGPLIIEKT